MKRPDISADLWRERYESLRLCSLERRQTLETEPLGLVLFLRLGLVGWMRHWAPAASEASARPAQSFQPPMMTTQWQSQLTALLAQMAARHLPSTGL